MESSTYTLDLFDEEPILENAPPSGEAFLRPAIQLTLKYLWQNWQKSKRPDLFSLDFIKLLWRHKNHVSAFYNAIFIEEDPFFLHAARRGVEESLVKLCTQFNSNPPKTPDALEKAQLAVHNTIGLYPAFNPTPHKPVTVPQYIDGKWEIVTYTVTPIELTPKKGLWLTLLGDRDRLFSYGLTPVNQPKAHPLLLHRGTGWGTSQGHAIQYLADIWPNKSPGEIFFEWQYDAIQKWISQAYQETGKKVITSGQSLGGSLSYLTALAFPDKIEKAYCLNPPGMAYDYPKDHPLFGAWENCPDSDRKNKVIIQKQADDLVSKCGEFKKDFQLLKIKAIEENAQPAHSLSSMLTSHARSFVHCDQMSWEKADMPTENVASRRLKNNRWLYRIGRSIAFYGFLVPYFFIFRPIKQFIATYAFEVFLFTTALILFCTIPPLAALLSLPFIPSFGSVFLSALLPSLALSQVISSVIKHTHDFFFNQRQKFNDYIQTLENLDPLPRKGKLLFDLLNILSLGLINIGIKTFESLFVRPILHLTKGRNTEAKIHTKAYYQQAISFEAHKPPTFIMKLRVFSLIAAFYIIATPLKCVFYDLPLFLYKSIKGCIGKICDKKPSMATSCSPRTSSSNVQENRRKKTHYGRFFSCICQKTEEDHPLDHDLYHQASP